MSTTEMEIPVISGVTIPDSKLAREATELVRDTESPLLFNHSTRVYYFGSLAGKRQELNVDPELLYVGAMFHDMGLTPRYSSKTDRFEVDGANSARAFLRQHNISEQEIELVWTAIALHTMPGIQQYMHPVIALITAGVVWFGGTPPPGAPITYPVLSNGQSVITAYAPGINPLIHRYQLGPFNWTMDASLFKAFKITEKTALQFNADFFNVLNEPGLNNPNTTTGIVDATVSHNTPRQMQLSLRFNF